MPDVGRHRGVGLTGCSGDRGARSARGVAPLPLVAERARLSAAPRAGDRGEQLAGLRAADDRRRANPGRGSCRIRRNRHAAEARPVEAVAVHAAGDARDVPTVAPLPERPAEPAPAGTGQDRKRGLCPVGDPESMTCRCDDGRVAQLRLPEIRRHVDDRLDAGAGDDLAEPRLHPQREARHGEAACILDVEHGEQLARERRGHREEIVGLGDCARDDRRIGRARGPGEVIRTEPHPQHRRARPVDRERQVGVRRPLRGLCEDERRPRSGHREPVDLVLPVRDVDPGELRLRLCPVGSREHCEGEDEHQQEGAAGRGATTILVSEGDVRHGRPPT